MQNEKAMMMQSGVTARVDPGDAQNIQIFQGGVWVNISRQELHALAANFPVVLARGGAVPSTCVTEAPLKPLKRKA